MPVVLSLYLDLVRFCAAAVVFVGHLGIPSFSSGFIPRQLEPYGSVAVAIFFVLSGYVIAHVSASKETSGALYAAARLSRLYSVVLIALPLTFFADTLGSVLQPYFYASRWVLTKPVSVEGYASSLVFLNEWQVFGFHGTEPGSNGPLWSLSFEATYYLIAGLALFARRWIAIPAILLILSLSGSTIAALLPLWALGFSLYHMPVRRSVHPALLWALIIASLVGVVCAPFLSQGFDRWWTAFPWGPLPMRRNLMLDYVTGLFFAVNILAVGRLVAASGAPTATWSRTLARTIRWLGRLTFPLYCLHYPLFAFAAANNPFSRATVAGLLFTAGSVFAAIALITPLTVRLNVWMRPRLTRLFEKSAPAIAPVSRGGL